MLNKKNLIASLFFSPLLLLFLTSCEKSTEPNESYLYTSVSNTLDSTRKALEKAYGKEIPSINLLVSTPQEEIFISSASNEKYKITKDTYFRFASNTKTFTSTSILNMQEDGWLNINDKITANIPGTSTPYVPTTTAWDLPYKSQITIKQLLQHSAGVYDVTNDPVPGCNGYSYQYFIESKDPNHQFTVSEMVNICCVNQLYYFVPGKDFHYSNTGYAILSEIIARVYSSHAVTEKKYSDYLYEYIIGGTSPVKLGIKFPYLATDQKLPSPFIPSTIYYSDNSIETISDINKSAQIGEGNGYGTMEMLKTWISTLIRGENVLNSNSLELIKTELAPNSSTYSLGFYHFSSLGFGHNGATSGYLSCMYYNPEYGVTVIGMIPMWNLTKGLESFTGTLNGLLDAAEKANTAYINHINY